MLLRSLPVFFEYAFGSGKSILFITSRCAASKFNVFFFMPLPFEYKSSPKSRTVYSLLGLLFLLFLLRGAFLTLGGVVMAVRTGDDGGVL